MPSMLYFILSLLVSVPNLGSMTGAPKLRSVQILEDLERRPRGCYSGSLGYISLNGNVHMSVVIRTAVFANGNVSLGAGGAIVYQSDSDLEYEEMLCKTRSVIPSLFC